MKRLVSIVLAGLLLSPVLALAQAATSPPPPPAAAPRAPMHPPELGKWWKNSDVVSKLQLTEAQIRQIEDTFLDFRLKLIDLRAEVERQEARLQPLIEADQPDEGKVSSQIDLVIAARGKLEKANTMMMLAIRKVLTVEQWKKLQSIQEQRRRMFRSPHGALGPGEPRTPHPPPAPTPAAMD